MKDTTRVLETSAPLRLEGTNGRAVIVQHGFNGYPAEMYGLAKRLNEDGFTVVVPRLPGHATNAADFRKTNWKLWRSHVREQYLNLANSYESVSIVGLSMGGLLALLTAADFEPEKIILLAPALSVRPRLVYFTPLLRFFVPVIDRKRAEPAPGTAADRLYMEREYWSRSYTAQLASFTRLLRMARRRLKDVSCPVYLMLSEKDNTVPLKAGERISRGIGANLREKVILKDSPHVFFEGPENDYVTDKVSEWVRIGDKND